MDLLSIFKAHPKSKWALLGVDTISVFIAAYITIWFRYKSGYFYTESTINYIKLYYLFVTIFPLVIAFRYFGLYKHRNYSKVQSQMRKIISGVISAYLVTIILLFFIRGDIIEHSRFITTTYFGVLSAMLIISRVGIMRFLLTGFGHLLDKRKKTIVVGSQNDLHQFMGRISGIKNNMFDIVGLLTTNSEKIGEEIYGYEIIGTSSEITKSVAAYSIEQIIITQDDITYSDLIDLLEVVKKLKISAIVNTRHFKAVLKHTELSDYEDFEEFNFVSFPSTVQSNDARNAFKRFMDIVSATILILVSIPIVIIISILVKITSKGPIFYSTYVVGHHQNLFKWYKIRSMYLDSDDTIHKKHTREIIKNGEQSGKKIQDDPRITPIGHFIRRHSLDELPQLFNVLQGTMSLVGPRPCLPYELETFKDWHKERFNVKPGLTGLWQVSGRNKSSFDDMIALDIYYANNNSIWLDFWILLKTIPVAIFGRGGG